MNKLLYFLFTATLLMVSCSDDDDEIRYQEEAFIKVSSWYVTFDQNAGSAVVAVIARPAAIKFEADGDGWLSADVAGDHITIDAKRNDTGMSRRGYVWLWIEGHEGTVRDSVYVFQAGVSGAKDISADGTANAYIVATCGDYKFDARVKGNGEAADGESQYIANYGNTITGAAYAELLWEATFDADRNRSRNIIEAYPLLDDGYIHFSTGDNEGNAVIAVKNSSGITLWSWHIWVSDTHIGSVEGNGYTWMDRNLGAINNTPGDMNNRGLIYQWGRKDPFLPSRVEYMVDGFDNIPAANINNDEVGNGTGVWNYAEPIRRFSEAPGNTEFSVRNPTSFLVNTVDYDWFVARIYDSYLWGREGEKTIFDPCPAGYKIPPGDAWDQDNIRDQWGEFTGNGRYWTGGSDDFFPMPGIRVYNNGLGSYCGALAMYWTSAIEPGRPMGIRLYLASNSISFNTIGRAYGGSVRCVKE